MLLAIPLEDLRLVLLFNATALERILLEEQVEGAIATAPFRDVHQLIVVPVLT